MAWNRSSEDGGPDLPFRWSQPGGADQYASLDALIAELRQRQEEHDALGEKILDLKARIEELQVEPKVSVRESLNTWRGQVAAALLWWARPGRERTPYQQARALARRQTRQRRETRTREELQVRAALTTASRRRDDLAGSSAALTGALLSKANAVIDDGAEGAATLVTLRDSHAAAVTERELLREALSLAGRARDHAFGAYLGWRTLGSLVADEGMLRLSAAPPQAQPVREAVARLRADLDTLCSRMAALGLAAQAVVPRSLAELDIPHPPRDTGRLTQLLATTSGDQITQWHCSRQQEVLHDVINALAQDRAAIQAALATVQAQIRERLGHLDRVLSRPL